ncbi:14268_t:CDS:2 [Entrophospora sp. SA101]|nr:14268_t:CDS:2 [Entrophospora sp. SA101]
MVENNSNTKSIRQELLNKLKTIAEAKTELEQKIAEEIKSKSRNNNVHPKIPIERFPTSNVVIADMLSC